MKRRLFILSMLFSGIACVPNPQTPVRLDLQVRGQNPPGSFESVGGVQVELEQAQLAFGPLYLCAGSSAGELCEVARAEWMGAVVVNLLSAQPQAAGEVQGSRGLIRSWMYDLGFASTLTALKPVQLQAAEALGGNSLSARGFLTFQGRRMPFDVGVVVAQDERSELGVPVIRKSGGEPFFHELKGDERALLISFEVRNWFAKTDFRAYFEQERCRVSGPALTCSAEIEQRCSPQGEVLGRRDCAALGQVCVSSQGCSPRLQIVAGSRAHRGLSLALSGGSRPRFTFVPEES